MDCATTARPIEWPTTPEGYELSRKIGNRVWKGYLKQEYLNEGGHQELVIKTVAFDTSFSARKQKVEAIVGKFKQLKHPAIIPCLHWFLTSKELWVIEDAKTWTEVNLGRLIRSKQFPDGLHERLVAAVLKEILVPIAYLHQNEVVWHDVRSKNVFINHDGQVLINTISLRSVLQERTRDSLPYVAPELLQSQPIPPPIDLACKADMWSVGIMAIELATGDHPFGKEVAPQHLTQRILDGPPPMLEETERKIWSREFKDMVAMCFQKDANLRPSATYLLEQPFFKSAQGRDYIVSELFGESDGSPAAAAAVAAEAATTNVNLVDNDHTLPEEPDDTDSVGSELSTTSATGGVTSYSDGDPVDDGDISSDVPSISCTESDFGGELTARSAEVTSSLSNLAWFPGWPHTPGLSVTLTTPQNTPGVTLVMSAPTVLSPVPPGFTTPTYPTTAATAVSVQSLEPTYPDPSDRRTDTLTVDSGSVGSGVASPTSAVLVGDQGLGNSFLTGSNTSSCNDFYTSDTIIPPDDPDPSRFREVDDHDGHGDVLDLLDTVAAAAAPTVTSTVSNVALGMTDDFNVPVETYLAESEDEFFVYLRTIPSTSVHLRLESHSLMITGSFPPLALLDEPNFVLLHEVNLNFEKRIPFPAAIDPNSCIRSLNKNTATMTIRIKKFRHKDLGNDLF